MYWYKRPWAYFYLFLFRLFVCFPPLTPLFILRKCSKMAVVTAPDCTRESEEKLSFWYWHLFWFGQLSVESSVNFGAAPDNFDWECEMSSDSGQDILLLAERHWWLLKDAKSLGFLLFSLYFFSLFCFLSLYVLELVYLFDSQYCSFKL